MAEAPLFIRIYAFLSVPLILYLSSIDASGALPLFAGLAAVLVTISSGLLRGSRLAWVGAMVFPLVALWLSLLIFDRYNSPASIRGTVTVWDVSNTIMAGFAVVGLIVLLWPSTWRWFWSHPQFEVGGRAAGI